MFRRRVGAIANYKRALRQIRRAQAEAPAPFVIRGDASGDFTVWRSGQLRAGPFDTRGEAQDWIDDPVNGMH